MLMGSHRDWRTIAYSPVIEAHYPESLISELPHQSSVLDVGCHDGTLSCYIAEERPDVAVRGIDINGDAIETARLRAAQKNLGNVRFNVGDVLDDGPEESFDAVLTVRLLTCFPQKNDWQRLLLVIEQRLAPRGRWCAIDYVFDERNSAYAGRYAAGERAGWRRGNFSVKTADGKTFIAHHHTDDELRLLSLMFDVTSFRRFESRSMHGNPVTMFELIARRRERA